MGCFFKFLASLLPLCSLCLATSCGPQTAKQLQPSPDSRRDMTQKAFTLTDLNCAAYLGRFKASASDVHGKVSRAAKLTMTEDSRHCIVESNGIPNHPFNDGPVPFIHPVVPTPLTLSIVKLPTTDFTTTPLTQGADHGVFLNGVPFDLLPATCFGARNAEGCKTSDTPWRYDPVKAKYILSADRHHAHSSEKGAYRYHGSPKGLFDESGARASGVIGFAADGFPIMGPYIEENGSIRKVESGFTLKVGPRKHLAGEAAFPGGYYDGTFRDDWHHTDAGDLDECNGRTLPDGRYVYHITSSFPWILSCFVGIPHPSFF